MEDRQLLSQYVQDGSQAAFAELVSRHVDLVYSTALRIVRAPALAEDITQMVFTNLARQAARLPRQMVLPGWLHRDACFTALDMLRAESRRQAREQEALRMSTLESNPGSDWEKLRPCLDEVLSRLPATDRDALLLRFFEKRSLKETGAALGLGEEAARKRVSRALEKLRGLLQQRGITTTSTALALALMANGIQSAPLGLAGTVAATIASGVGIGASASLMPVIKTIFMSHLKSIAAGAAILASLGYNAHQYYTARSLQRENAGLRQRLDRLSSVESENERLANLLASAGKAGLTADQFSELLRLRGEVARMRAHPPAAAAPSPSEISEANEADDNAKTFTTQLTANVGNGKTLVAGGWGTAPGKRSFLLLAAHIEPEVREDQMPPDVGAELQPKATVTIENTAIELPESVLAQLGLDSIRAEGTDSMAYKVLNESTMESFFQWVTANIKDGHFLGSKISVLDGMTAALSTGVSNATNHYAGALKISVTPKVANDLDSMQLSIQASLSSASNE